MTYPPPAITLLSKVRSTKFATVIGGQGCTLISNNTFQATNHVNVEKRRVDRVHCPPVIHHLTRFVILILIESKQVTVVVRNLVDRVFFLFGPSETLPYVQGKEFENRLVEKEGLFEYTRVYFYLVELESGFSVCRETLRVFGISL